jgi:hypothetical protein
LPVEKLHHEEHPAVRRLSAVEHAHGVVVPHCVQEAPFAEESLARSGTLGQTLVKHFDGYPTTGGVLGLVHGGHTATPQLAYDTPFVAERRPDQELALEVRLALNAGH